MIAPLNMDDPQAFRSELLASEQNCLSENSGPQRLMALLSAPELASPEETAELIQCLEDETLLGLFLTGLNGPLWPMSTETSTCVRSGFADFDLRAVMLAGGVESDEEAAMVGSMAAFLLTLSCLNEEEWQAATRCRRPSHGFLRRGDGMRAANDGRTIRVGEKRRHAADLGRLEMGRP